MKPGTIETRLRRLEEQHRVTDPMAEGPWIETIADKGDEAEHERQAAEQKRAIGWREGEPFRHMRIDIVDPPPRSGPGARPRNVEPRQ